MTMKLKNLCVALVTTSLLAACAPGNGGGSNPAPQPDEPAPIEYELSQYGYTVEIKGKFFYFPTDNELGQAVDDSFLYSATLNGDGTFPANTVCFATIVLQKTKVLNVYHLQIANTATYPSNRDECDEMVGTYWVDLESDYSASLRETN